MFSFEIMFFMAKTGARGSEVGTTLKDRLGCLDGKFLGKAIDATPMCGAIQRNTRR